MVISGRNESGETFAQLSQIDHTIHLLVSQGYMTNSLMWERRHRDDLIMHHLQVDSRMKLPQ